ncbi:hypothetical protein PV682_34620 [Streptomyces niveiscabiei]|uniref:hypothetical protein n=1 Tax=Streptomyces niveiscabiei TaxID=164115 RepID=UPI0029B7ECE0|nr:hypothetical protein [Streptomyces niveiscabiei]MDX3386545.1 hypothetical protein [Streptomyces niveiscabiei]
MVTAEHIGKTVTDGQRTGILMALLTYENPAQLPAVRRSQLMAYVRPESGGIEWDTPPSELRLA